VISSVAPARPEPVILLQSPEQDPADQLVLWNLTEEESPMGKMDGMVAAVTGGASGIGEATVRRLIAEGAGVAFADRDATRGRRVAEEIAADGGRALFVEADVGREPACLAFIQQTLERFGRLNVLVNNAGIRMYQTVVEATAESWDEILSVNLKSYAYCAKGAIPAMRRVGGGSIVNVASVRSIVAGGNNIQYDTAKHAVAGLTRGLAMDHGGEGIRVNAVCPGPIFTPFHARRLQTAGKTVAQYNEDAASRTMLKRPGTAEEVAACILFLASNDASYVTGSLLFVDGGMTAM
jgi:2-hydroxycyclohexanecarboxyl-CoA dehydrogenase